MKKAILCGKLFDSQNKTVLKDKVVITEDKNIVEVADRLPDGLEAIDLSGAFVMPGLIDAHVHVMAFSDATGSMDYAVLSTVGDYAYRALINAQKDLMAGFTTIRDAGGREFIDVALRDAIRKGMFDGPNIVAAGSGLGTTGSHSDSHFAPYISTTMDDVRIANGPDGFRQAARYMLKHGADYIKYMATGGVMSRGTTVGAQQMTYEEMRAITEIAEMYGVHTATHAHGTNGIKTAVKAGVTSVEHGMILDDECIELMLQKGTYLTPTIIAADRIANSEGLKPYMVEKARLVLETHKNGVQKCLSRGVKLSFGTDAGTPFNDHGEQTHEFGLMCSFGFTPMQALCAATDTNSRLLRMERQIGSIEAGKLADIVAFRGDPLEDITEMTRCFFVMSRGKVVKS